MNPHEFAEFEKFEAFERPPVGFTAPGGFVPPSELPPQPFHQFVESFTNVSP